MAVTNLMLQVEAQQEFDVDVSTVPHVMAEVFEFLNGGTVTVREVAVEKMGGIAGNNTAIPLDLSPTGFVTLRVFTGGDGEVDFYAPTSVSSPPVQNSLVALLELQDIGLSAPQNVLQGIRQLGAHAYFDEST